MFGSLGFPELILIFGVALIVFGPKRLPEIGRTIGKAMGEFKKATNDLKSTLEEEVRVHEQPAVDPLRRLAPTGTLAANSIPTTATAVTTETPAAAVNSAPAQGDPN